MKREEIYFSAVSPLTLLSGQLKTLLFLSWNKDRPSHLYKEIKVTVFCCPDESERPKASSYSIDLRTNQTHTCTLTHALTQPHVPKTDALRRMAW